MDVKVEVIKARHREKVSQFHDGTFCDTCWLITEIARLHYRLYEVGVERSNLQISEVRLRERIEELKGALVEARDLVTREYEAQVRLKLTKITQAEGTLPLCLRVINRVLKNVSN